MHIRLLSTRTVANEVAKHKNNANEDAKHTNNANKVAKQENDGKLSCYVQAHEQWIMS